MPTPFPGSGGHRNIFRAVRYLSEFGHFVRMYFPKEGHFATSQQLEHFLDSSFFATGAEVILALDDINACDDISPLSAQRTPA